MESNWLESSRKREFYLSVDNAEVKISSSKPAIRAFLKGNVGTHISESFLCGPPVVRCDVSSEPRSRQIHSESQRTQY